MLAQPKDLVALHPSEYVCQLKNTYQMQCTHRLSCKR